MKIVRIIARLNVGGPARHVTWLTQALQDDEFESVLVAGVVPDGEEDMSYAAAAAGVKPIYLAEMSRELSPKDLVVIWKLFLIFRRERPDIIHTHTAKAGTVGRIAAFAYNLARGAVFGRRRTRVVHTFHGHVFHSYYNGFKTSIFLFIERILAAVATDRIVTISSEQRREISKEFRVGRDVQFATIPLGIDLDALEPKAGDREKFRSELGVADGDILIGFVGRLTEIKNIPMLIDVARRYSHEKASARLRFVIVGDGHLRRPLEDAVAASGAAGEIIFAGNRSDIAAVYAGLDIVVLASLNEGTPLSLIEAMAARRPFVTTMVGGVPDLIGEMVAEHGSFSIHKNGIGVRSDDAAGMLEALLYLAENERLRLSTASSGRLFVEQNYAKERLVRDIKELYRSLST